MDYAGKTVTSDTTGAGKWMGRVVIAVILGEAIWSLIVSVMNNLVVPWVGDMMGAIFRFADLFPATSL